MTDEPMVYLLDDEPEMLKALARLLRAEGFQVRGFSSAREFLAHVRPHGPACLVLDVAMPEIEGDLCTRSPRPFCCPLGPEVPRH